MTKEAILEKLIRAAAEQPNPTPQLKLWLNKYLDRTNHPFRAVNRLPKFQ